MSMSNPEKGRERVRVRVRERERERERDLRKWPVSSIRM